MKKILIVLLSLAMAVCCFTACSDKEFQNLKFENAEAVYDGQPKTLTVAGAPEKAEIAYSYTDASGSEVQQAVNPGTYTVTATVKLKGYKTAVLTASLKINALSFGDGVVYENFTQSFTGGAINVERATGIPEGASARYQIFNSEGQEVSEAVSVGRYTVKLTVSKTGYADFEKTVELNIIPSDFAPDSITMTDKSAVYDGTAKKIEAVGIPDGASVVYSYEDGDGNIVAEAVMPGLYTVTAVISKTGFNDLTLSARLTVTPAAFTGITFENFTAVYRGTAVNVNRAKGVPQGAEAVYSIKNSAGDTVNEAVNAGKYTVEVTVSKPGYSDLTLVAELQINKAKAVITADSTQYFDFSGEYYYIDAELNHSETVLPVLAFGAAKAGTYSVTLLARETANYQEAKKEVTMIISDVPVTENEPELNEIDAVELVPDPNKDKPVTESDADFSNPAVNASEFQLPLLVGDRMLLQALKPARIWGNCSTDGEIKVIVRNTDMGIDEAYYGVAENGYFELFMGAQPYGLGYEIELISSAKKSVIIRDVAFGELFIAGGQSNMGWVMAQCYGSTIEENIYQDIIDSSYNENIRLFGVSADFSQYELYDDVKKSHYENGWVYANPSDVKWFSAAGYFFAREMEAQYGVPVGVVMSAMGGTAIYTWMPPEEYEETKQKGEVYGPTEPDLPGQSGSIRYNAMIHPLRRLVVRGVAWFQGEGHINYYAQNLVTMINGWRRVFENPNMLFVTAMVHRQEGEEEQFEYRNFYSREQHKLASTMIDGLVASSNIDLGIPRRRVAEGDNLNSEGEHPYNKEYVGIRLANNFMKAFFGAEGTWTSPEVKSISVDNNRVILKLSGVGSGLMLTNRAGFELAGADGKFVDAYPTLASNDTVILQAEGVDSPVQIRYGYSNNSIFQTGNLTSFEQCVCVYNTKNGEKAYPLDQFIITDIKQSGKYEEVKQTNAYNFDISDRSPVAFKGKTFKVPDFTLIKNGADMSAEAEAYAVCGGVETPIEGSFVPQDDFYLEIRLGGDLFFTSFVKLGAENTQIAFDTDEGTLEAVTGETFALPEFTYSYQGENGAVDLSGHVETFAVYGEYREKLYGDYVQKIYSDFDLEYRFNGEVIYTRPVSVSSGYDGNTAGNEDVWDLIPNVNWFAYGKIGNKAETFYNGKLTAVFTLQYTSDVNVIIPLRGDAKALGSENPDANRAYRLVIGKEGGKVYLYTAYADKIIGSKKDITSVISANAAKQKHILSVSVGDVYGADETFEGISVTVFIDGAMAAQYDVAASLAYEAPEFFLTPAAIIASTHGNTVNYEEYYTGENQAFIYRLEGEIPDAVKEEQQLTLPKLYVMSGDSAQYADAYVNGILADDVYNFGAAGDYLLEYKCGEKLIYSQTIRCNEDMDIDFSFVTQTDKVNAGETFNLPQITVTNFGSDIKDEVTMRIRMGSHVLETGLPASASTYKVDAACVLEIEYIYHNVVIESCTLQVGYEGNILEDTANWRGSEYTKFRQYNSRVNITFTMGEIAQVTSIPLRGYAQPADFYDGLAFRISKVDSFFMKPVGALDICDIPSMVSMFGTKVLTGEVHVFSYQLEDLLDNSGNLSGIRLRIWADGKPVQISGKDYYDLPVTHASWRDVYADPAVIASSVNPGFIVKAITFGDTADMTGMVSLEGSSVLPAGSDMDFRVVGLKSGMTAEIVYIGSDGVAVAKPTATGDYTVRATVTGAGFYDKTLEASLKLVPPGEDKTISYSGGDGASGEGIGPFTVSQYFLHTVQANTFVKKGFTFTGWSDGITLYRPGDVVQVEDDMQFTAQWEEIDFSERVVNGNFDGEITWLGADANGWGYSGANHGWLEFNNKPREYHVAYDAEQSATEDGTGSFKFGVGNGFTGWTETGIQLQAGVTYTFKISVKVVDFVESGWDGYIRIVKPYTGSAEGAEAVEGTDIGFNPASWSSEWTEVEKTFTAEETGTYYIRSWLYGIGGGSVWIDDLSVKAVEGQ